MRIEKLGKYISEVSVRNKKGSVTDVFSVTNSQGFIKSTEYFSKEVYSKDVSNYKIVCENEFAYNPSRINVGSIDYLKQKNQVVISPLYVVFKCSNELNEEYLKVFLKSPIGNSRIRAKTKGAVRDTLSFGSLCEIKIPILPIADQLHIANLLSKAENLIAQRKESIRLLDEFLKSTFLEMFGDITYNKVKLGEVLEIQSGQVNPNEYPYSDMYHVGAANVESNTGKLINLKYAKDENLISGKYFFTKDHVLYSKIRPNLNKVAMPDFSGICSADMYPLLPDKKRLDKNYLRFTLMSSDFLSYALKHSDRTNIPKINRNALVGYSISLPSISLQTQFAQIVEKTEVLKTQYQQSLQELENLYGSLSQKAFKGELSVKQAAVQ